MQALVKRLKSETLKDPRVPQDTTITVHEVPGLTVAEYGFDKVDLGVVCNYLERGHSRRKACNRAGIRVAHLKEAEKDIVEISTILQNAEEEFADKIVETAIRMATGVVETTETIKITEKGEERIIQKKNKYSEKILLKLLSAVDSRFTDKVDKGSVTQGQVIMMPNIMESMKDWEKKNPIDEVVVESETEETRGKNK